jgi:P-type E1-E2 ATPase
VQLVVASDSERREVLARAAALASSSTHGHSLAISQFAERELPTGETTSLMVRTLPGRGLIAQPREGSAIALGSPRLMQESGLHCGEVLAGILRQSLVAGRPLACIGWNGAVRGIFLFEEQFRDQAEEAVAQLQQQGLHVAVLTGDHAGRGAAVSRLLGIPVEAELLPADKVAAVARAQRRYGPVAMVGDGINDAPALASSDVGIALGCGTDVSRDAAAVCLLGNVLGRLPWTIDLARRTVGVIRQNLFWAFLYNGLGIGLACTGRLNPMLAALGMVLSSLLVVTNSLRLGRDPGEQGP